MKVIHFITDEKFLNSTIELFEEIEELDNRYINIIFDEDKPYQFLTSDKVEKINISDVHNIITNPSVCDVIVIHNLSSLPCEQIMNIDKKIKVVWFSWGFDIYNNEKPQFPLITLKKQIFKKTFTPRYRIRILNEKRRAFFKNLFHKDYQGKKDFIQAIHRIDYFSGVFPIEYDYLKKNSFFRAKQILFSYPFNKGTINKDDLYKSANPNRDTIQISHSGTVLANHGNTFWKLHQLKIGNRKILVPLSYGGTHLYRSIVCKRGKQLFGDNFLPLSSFVELDRYELLIQSVSIAIHNTIRQIAVGNILLNMWNGAKVFLPEDSINYKHFKSQGYHVFSIEKDLNQKEIDSLLSDEMIIDNRKKIIKYHSYEAIKEKTTNSFRQIANDLNIPFSASPIS